MDGCDHHVQPLRLTKCIGHQFTNRHKAPYHNRFFIHYLENMSLIINALAYVHPDGESLFSNIHLALQKGEKASLVGHNGSGKSTLLKIIAGQLPASEGEIILRSTAYYLPQHPGQYDQWRIADVLQVGEKINALQAILRGETSEENFHLLDDDWEIEDRVRSALSHWDIQHLDIHSRLQTLSGGEKTKVFLAGILLHSPDILVMDEPSNQLDTTSRSRLYDFITKSKSTLLVVSHDRKLLNLVDTTIELQTTTAAYYGGNYDFYKEQKALKTQALESQLKEKERNLKQARQQARETAVQRQKQESRGKTQKAKAGIPRILMGGLKNQAEKSSAKLNKEQTEKIDREQEAFRRIKQELQSSKTLKIDIRNSALHKGKILVKAEEINLRYGDKDLWAKPLSFTIYSGDRIRIAGDNGSGKTSLIHLITGQLKPSSGRWQAASFRYLYIDQEYSLISDIRTVYEQVQSFNDRLLPEHELKMLLHYHLFTKEYWNRPCASLSGGEKMKLLLCCLAISDNMPDILILDEPTNNLDIRSLEIVSEAMAGFKGSLLVVSHDDCFIEELSIDKWIQLPNKTNSTEIKHSI